MSAISHNQTEVKAILYPAINKRLGILVIILSAGAGVEVR
jgi:hypothetical protein